MSGIQIIQHAMRSTVRLSHSHQARKAWVWDFNFLAVLFGFTARGRKYFRFALGA